MVMLSDSEASLLARARKEGFFASLRMTAYRAGKAPGWARVVVLLIVAAAGISRAAETRTLEIREFLGHTWTNELDSCRLEFKPGQCWPHGIRLFDEAGKALPVQLTDLKTHPDGSLASGTLWFLVDKLPARGKRSWTFEGGRKGDKPPRYRPDLALDLRKDFCEITTSKVGVRLLAGSQRLDPPLPADKAPVPLQAIRLRGGAWIGRGRWDTEPACTGYQALVVAEGPVFAEACVRVNFAGDKHYTATYRVVAGQEVVLVEEEFDLGDPKRFVLPDYDERYRLMWDWWAQTHGRSPSPNNLIFSLYDAKSFAPDTARWFGHHATIPERGKGGGADFAIDYTKSRLDITLNSWLQWGDDESVFYTAWNKANPTDALAVVAIRPSKWIHPDLLPHSPGFIKQHTQTNNIGVWVSPPPDLYLRSPVNRGKRAYLLAALDAKTDVGPDPTKPDRSAQLLVQYGHKPLDKIKDWVLGWQASGAHPRLFCKPGDLAALRKRAESQPEHFQHMKHRAVFRYLATGDDKEAVKAFEEAMTRLRDLVTRSLEGFGPHDGTSNHMMWGWRMHDMGAELDVALASPAITPDQRREAQAVLAYIQHAAWDPDHFPGRENGFAWGSANQGSTMMTGRALWAKLLADHPLAKQWAADGAKFAIYDLERYLHPASGVAMECPAYAATAVTANLTVLFALQDMADVSPVLSRLRALARWRLDTQPPPDPRFGLRTLPTLGDSPYHGDNIIGLLGMALLKSDPELAANCLWAFRQGGEQGAGFVDRLFLIDNSLPDTAPRVASRQFPGVGAVLRTGTLAPDETYLCYYHGSFSFGHYHSDQGQLIFYAKGAPLMMDFGSQYQPSIRQACFHNTISYNHREWPEPKKCPGRDTPGCFYTGKRWFGHDVEPFTCLEYAFDETSPDPSGSLGEIKEFAALPAADYARGEQPQRFFHTVPYRYEKPDCFAGFDFGKPTEVPPFLWSRQVILVKDADPKGTSYLLVHDDLSGNQRLEPAFNLWSLTKGVEPRGDQPFHTLSGQWGVDLDVFVAEPASPRIGFGELAHQNASVNADRFKRLHNRPFEERQSLFRILGKPGDGFTVAIYPRKPDEPKPQFARLAGVPGVKVTMPNETHWVIASRTPVTFSEGPLSFSGTAAVVKQFADGRASLTLLAPGKLSLGALTLESDKPATREAAGNR